MQFSTIRSIVGWAFQMSEAVPVKSAKYGEFTGAAFGGLTPIEQKNMATDILAKAGRLPASEQAALAAYYTSDTRAIKKLAGLCLPAGWPVPMKLELTRAWANDEQLERSQILMAECYMLSEPTMTRRKQEAFRLLGQQFAAALRVLEVQLWQELQHPTPANAHRRASACLAA